MELTRKYTLPTEDIIIVISDAENYQPTPEPTAENPNPVKLPSREELFDEWIQREIKKRYVQLKAATAGRIAENLEREKHKDLVIAKGELTGTIEVKK